MHDQIFFPIAAVLIPLQPQPEKGRGVRRFYDVEADPAIETDEMRIRDAEAASAIQLSGDGRKESFPDSLALKPRVNLHAAQHNSAFFCRQPNNADQLTVTFREEHRILRPNPAAVSPLSIEVCHSRDVLSHRTSNFDQHSCTGSEWAERDKAQARRAGAPIAVG